MQHTVRSGRMDTMFTICIKVLHRRLSVMPFLSGRLLVVMILISPWLGLCRHNQKSRNCRDTMRNRIARSRTFQRCLRSF